MQICDFVVSKPGGAQSTESLYFKKPIIMINCSGGQEIANYKYFVKNGYGRRFRAAFTFAKYMKAISDDPSIIAKMKKNMSKNNSDKAMGELYKIIKDNFKK
jgi:UDP-N-acetylglucosamine:LPS N-acetylglucosamine transferase